MAQLCSNYILNYIFTDQTTVTRVLYDLGF
jgi:hypothetical protein